MSYDRDLEHVPKIVQKKPVSKKVPVKPPSGQKKKRTGPSKYMQEILRLNIVEMIHNYDKLQMKKRVAAVKLAGKFQIKEVDEEDLEISAELPVNLKHTEGIIN